MEGEVNKLGGEGEGEEGKLLGGRECGRGGGGRGGGGGNGGVFKLSYTCIVLRGQMVETHPVVPILKYKHVNTRCNTATYCTCKNLNSVNS